MPTFPPATQISSNNFTTKANPTPSPHVFNTQPSAPPPLSNIYNANGNATPPLNGLNTKANPTAYNPTPPPPTSYNPTPPSVSHNPTPPSVSHNPTPPLPNVYRPTPLAQPPPTANNLSSNTPPIAPQQNAYAPMNPNPLSSQPLGYNNNMNFPPTTMHNFGANMNPTPPLPPPPTSNIYSAPPVRLIVSVVLESFFVQYL